ncbi:apoptosis-associated speck-like protein containing a CARD [Girardinichthys multiradiatus]|uniref:apoptosis-associated speck-like protein containing a CARD n=1 Tax=Girardinichthys multiradiatus TaxID=208333 RepID=UPI001FAC3940|nr:apoptosis-associated speck-like protein containing a CARD [Girardinichthys multiradiatus]
MPRRSIKLLLADTLEDLSNQNFEKFCYHLLDRRQEPRVRRSRVEGKKRLDIVDVLVSTFTEEGAVGVTEEILREIGCNSEAETLEMPPKSARKLLKNSLESLTKENFEKFRSELLDRRDGVKMNQVQGKSFLEVADVMISVYTERRVLNVAEEILKEICCGQEACELAEEAKKAGLQSSDAASSDEKHFVDKHMDELIQKVSNVLPILDKLLKAGVIQPEVYDNISAERTSQAKMRALCHGPLRASRKVQDIFLDILKAQEPFLFDDLMKR